MKTIIQVCKRCIMDTTANEITFDKKGNCNYCTDLIKRLNIAKKKDVQNNLENLVNNIKKNNRKKKYDCIIGLSGGVDSSYTLLKSIEMGLRPLAVHLDNGWNSELAQHNISNLVNILNVDLYTHVVDWTEYKNFQEAFFKANVIDIELLMDNAMLAINYKLANKYNIKNILSGTNTSTEGMKIPNNWSWFKNDVKNIKYIGKKFTNQKIKTLPTFSTFDFIYYELFKKIKWVLFLDNLDYVKEDAIKELINKCNYKPYPYKHYESVFTRFYQAYILPKKFNVDKRKLHLSNLIITNQMNRENALLKLSESAYTSQEEEKKDINYFLKKMDWSSKKFQNYLQEPEIKHDFYPSEIKLWNNLKLIYINLKKIKKFFI